MQWNLEQLQVFLSVAEGHSFSAVGRRMNRAQSAVSNAIAMLDLDTGDLRPTHPRAGAAT